MFKSRPPKKSGCKDEIDARDEKTKGDNIDEFDARDGKTKVDNIDGKTTRSDPRVII